MILKFTINEKDEKIKEANNKYLETYKTCKNFEDLYKDSEKKLSAIEKEKDKKITILETKLEFLAPKTVTEKEEKK
ncbi:hypothetical protein [Arcobacter defluvii]|uniref:Uncharacterized protein n=1 Tax=Arcobacter defluvii TaxID=873191 RepID=A0AAE7BDI9_9BACT|nr:hypothetical protein [Arcobacter defluvii]QKF77336.1 hypothetical protein ADFLV_1304 [Arcobacter defluvii]RXI29614.1 hypothetical protein CP964_13285 [Arcobacter defluvii]